MKADDIVVSNILMHCQNTGNVMMPFSNEGKAVKGTELELMPVQRIRFT